MEEKEHRRKFYFLRKRAKQPMRVLTRMKLELSDVAGRVRTHEEALDVIDKLSLDMFDIQVPSPDSPEDRNVSQRLDAIEPVLRAQYAASQASGTNHHTAAGLVSQDQKVRADAARHAEFQADVDFRDYSTRELRKLQRGSKSQSCLGKDAPLDLEVVMGKVDARLHMFGIDFQKHVDEALEVMKSQVESLAVPISSLVLRSDLDPYFDEKLRELNAASSNVELRLQNFERIIELAVPRVDTLESSTAMLDTRIDSVHAFGHVLHTAVELSLERMQELDAYLFQQKVLSREILALQMQMHTSEMDLEAVQIRCVTIESDLNKQASHFLDILGEQKLDCELVEEVAEHYKIMLHERLICMENNIRAIESFAAEKYTENNTYSTTLETPGNTASPATLLSDKITVAGYLVSRARITDMRRTICGWPELRGFDEATLDKYAAILVQQEEKE